MKDAFFIDFSLTQQKYADEGGDGNVSTVSKEDLKIINGLKTNGPLKKLTADEIQTRGIIIMGIEPTSKLSIHPQGMLNGKKMDVLGKMSRLLPGCPMLVGHRTDKTPWGRTYKSELIDKLPGYKGAVVKENFWFLNDLDGQAISRKIDSGIWAEGSISYWFKDAKCSICHKDIASWWSMSSKGCKHTIGKKDKETGQICYWYPSNIQKIAETSYVFAGAYGKTKSLLDASNDELSAMYSPDQITAGRELEKQLADYGLNLNQENSDEEEHQDNQTGENRPPISIDNPKAEDSKSTEENDDSAKAVQSPHGQNNQPGQETKPDGENSGLPTDENQSSSDESKIDGDRENDPDSQNSGNNRKPDGSSNESGENGHKQKGLSHTPKSNPDANNQNDGKVTDETEKSKETEENSGSDNSNGDSKEKTKGDTTGEHTGKDGDNLSGDHVDKENSDNPDNSKSQGADSGKDESDQTTQKSDPENSKGRNNATPESSETTGNQENKGGGTKEAGNHSEKQEESAGDYSLSEAGKAVIEILSQESLDSDEKETAVEELCIDQPGSFCDWCAALLSDSNKPVDEVLERFLSCERCGYAGKVVEGESKQECDDCGGKLIVSETYSAKVNTPVGQIQPRKTSLVNNVFYKLEDFRMLPDGTYHVEPEYDGVWFEMHKNGSDVKLLTGKGINLENKFPGIIKEAQNLSVDNFIIAGEMVKFRGNQRLSYDDVIEWVENEKEEYDDKSFRFKPFDIMVLSNEDKTGCPYEDRRELLDENIKWGKQINPTKFYKVIHKKGDGSLLRAIENRKTREGAVVRNSVSLYRKGDEDQLYSWRRYTEVLCSIVAKKENDEGAFVYTCEIGRGENVKPIGETFPTELNVSIGSIISVKVDHVNRDTESGDLSWFTPKVLSIHHYNHQADLIAFVESIAIPVELNSSDENNKEENANENEQSEKFVIQEHGWGKSLHYDFRFSTPGSKKLWGFALLTKPSTEAGGPKVRGHEKNEHDAKWMEFDKNVLYKGDEGNPSEKFCAHMDKKDSGEYELVRKKEGFCEVVLHGEKYNGRYIFRVIGRSGKSDKAALSKIIGDEASVKDDKIWVMWKPKDQTSGAPINKMNFSVIQGHVAFWETNEIDNDLELLDDIQHVEVTQDE